MKGTDIHLRTSLEKLLAETAAVMGHLPYQALLEHGKLRAEAMQIRDVQAAREA